MPRRGRRCAAGAANGSRRTLELSPLDVWFGPDPLLYGGRCPLPREPGETVRGRAGP